jgi:hypothetical protein
MLHGRYNEAILAKHRVSSIFSIGSPKPHPRAKAAKALS